MAALHERRARLLASLYRTFGEAADWTPAAGGAAIPLTVRRRGPEMVDVGFGDRAQAQVESILIRVRASELAAPGPGDLVVVQVGDLATETYRVIADPRRVKAGLEWECEVAP